jgi:hypothetical protein
MVDGGGTGHGANVEQDTDVGLEDGAKGVEEPPMRVDFFLVFFFKAEDDLDRDDAAFDTFQFKSGIYLDLGKTEMRKEKRQRKTTDFEWYTHRYEP